MQTECPHCQTVFKVSDENLKVADGFVRCGLCKEVFNALEKDKPDNKDASANQAKDSDKAPTNKVKQHDDTVEFVLEKSSEVNTGKAKAGDTPASQKKKTEPSEPKPEKTLSTPSEKKPSDANSTQTTAKQSNAKQIKQTAAKALDKALNAEPPIQKATAAIIAEPTPGTEAASGHKEKETQYQPDKAIENNLFDGVQSKLIPDEYRIPELHNTYSLWRDLTWSIAILILTASLFVEYAWFNRNELIGHPQLRPLVTQLCEIANCDMMELRKPSEIEMTTRNIYTHPNVKNALMISGTIINHAEFEQSYPDILIDFSNVRGEVIASRVFTPGDYLQIKSTSLRPLPPRLPIDFNMEIQDPGNKAITYEFSFL